MDGSSHSNLQASHRSGVSQGAALRRKRNRNQGATPALSLAYRAWPILRCATAWIYPDSADLPHARLC